MSEATKVPFASRTIFADAFCNSFGKAFRDSSFSIHVPARSLGWTLLQPNITKKLSEINRNLNAPPYFSVCSRSPWLPGSHGNQNSASSPTSGLMRRNHLADYQCCYSTNSYSRSQVDAWPMQCLMCSRLECPKFHSLLNKKARMSQDRSPRDFPLGRL
jgi:hypothetical protein